MSAFSAARVKIFAAVAGVAVATPHVCFPFIGPSGCNAEYPGGSFAPRAEVWIA